MTETYNQMLARVRGGELSVWELDRVIEHQARLIEMAREALQGMSDMYTHAWDLSDGGLIMIEPSIPHFEQAHTTAKEALSELSGDKPINQA